MALTGESKLVNLGQLKGLGNSIKTITDGIRTDVDAAVKTITFINPPEESQSSVYIFNNATGDSVGNIEISSDLSVAEGIYKITRIVPTGYTHAGNGILVPDPVPPDPDV